MTEAEWLACDKVTTRVMNWLRRRGSQRKFYLAGCAAVRHIWNALEDQRLRDLVDLVERFADGTATRDELARAHRICDAEVFKRFQELHTEGRSPSQIGKMLAGKYAAVHCAMPGGAYEACYSALVDAARVGKRSEQWRWQCGMLRDIFGNPFRPVAIDSSLLKWRNGVIVSIARKMYEDGDFEAVPILADALEEAGCMAADITDHCRGPGPHVRGCWVVDLVLGQE